MKYFKAFYHSPSPAPLWLFHSPILLYCGLKNIYFDSVLKELQGTWTILRFEHFFLLQPCFQIWSAKFVIKVDNIKESIYSTRKRKQSKSYFTSRQFWEQYRQSVKLFVMIFLFKSFIIKGETDWYKNF